MVQFFLPFHPQILFAFIFFYGFCFPPIIPFLLIDSIHLAFLIILKLKRVKLSFSDSKMRTSKRGSRLTGTNRRQGRGERKRERTSEREKRRRRGRNRMDRGGRGRITRGMLPLLGFQVLSEYSRLHRKPPVTAGLLLTNTLIYLRPGFLRNILPTLDEVWFNPHLILKVN